MPFGEDAHAADGFARSAFGCASVAYRGRVVK
jgi:hypothetical protein